MVSDDRLITVDNISVLVGSPERRQNQQKEQEICISPLSGSKSK